MKTAATTLRCACLAVAMLSALSAAAGETRYNGMKYFGAAGDWVSVRLEGYEADELPAVYADSGVRKVIVRHEVPNIGVMSAKGHPFFLDGELSATLRSWDGAFERPLGTQRVHLRYGQEKTFPLDLAGLKPGAYVVTVELPPHIRADNVFNPTNTGGGMIGMPMLYGRNAMRIAVFPNIEPAKVFGVGNKLIHCNEWWQGQSLSNTLEARDLKPVAVSGHGVDGCDAWYDAILQAFGAEQLMIDLPGPKGEADMNNEAAKRLDIFSPKGRAELERRAEATGRRLGRNAGVMAANLANESPHFNLGAPCPTRWADGDFRAFCRDRYKGDLAAANKAWGRRYSAWEEVRQPLYAADASNIVAKTGNVEPDWFANMGRMDGGLVKYLNFPENLAFSMDWYRWRTKASVDMYAAYAATAHRFDKKTLYCNNYCWPNFFAHLVLPTWRRLDAAAVDCQYVCKFPRTLGSNAEMIEILEMAESVMKGRPVIGWEIYLQPHYPEEMAALQNWAMVAHGVTVNLVFAWKPYSDRGQKVFKNGPRAWERPEDACAMWMLIDTDGTRLPVYYGVKRSAEEIAAFHAEHDALSLGRTHGRTAVYLSNETSMYTLLKTGDRPYLDSKLCHSRNRIANGLRIGGARIEYLDDETVGELTRKDYDAVVMPPTPYIAEAPAARLDAFEKEGGKVIRLDDWTKDFFEKYPEVPRSAYWAAREVGADVEVVVRTQKGTGRRFLFVLNRSGAATDGRLAGTDFADNARFADAITGAEVGNGFSLSPYGYRVLILK